MNNNVLILGGTRFVGRHIADAFQAAGFTVTLFNRGLTDTAARPGIEQIHGDRRSDLELVANSEWDAVVDTCGYTPDVVEQSAHFFESRTRRYAFISSVSVYDFERAEPGPVDEDAPLETLAPDVDRTTMDNERYGGLKVLCEGVVLNTFEDRATILRPGLVVGPYDPTDRFTYWPMRIAAGGNVLAPPPDSRLQYIDARDLAAFTVTLTRWRTGGTFNVVVQPESYTFLDLLEAARCASRSQAEIFWAREEILLHHGAEPWTEVPLWIPRSSDMYPLTCIGSSRAQVQGLKLRPLSETVRDTLLWATANRKLSDLHAGFSMSREAAIFADLD